MRRAPWKGILLAVCAAFVLGACGSSGSSGSPLQTELSYLPTDSPLVVTVQTDPRSPGVSNAMAFLNRFAFAPLLESAVITRLRQAGVNYDADVKPLFGNPVAVATSSTSLSQNSGRQFVVAWVTHDAGALNSLISKPSSGLRKAGSHDGATLYQGTNVAAAVDGSTLVLAPNSALVTSALDRHAQGGGISQSVYTSAMSGLPADGLISVFGDLRRVLATSSRSGGAAQVPWVAAIRSFGVSLSLSATGMRVSYRVDTGGSALTAAQLPIAPGTAAPRLASGAPISAGIRGFAHVFAFAQSAEQVANPSRYATFQRREARLRSHTGANLSDLVGQMTGDLIVSSDTRGTLLRDEVANPGTAGRILARIASDPRDAFDGSTSVSRAGGLYVFHRPSGSTVTVGVVSGKLVAGIKASPSQVTGFATSVTAPAAGAQGSAAFSLGLSELIGLASRRAGQRVPSALLRSLSNLTGWLSATTSGLQGQASLSFK